MDEKNDYELQVQQSDVVQDVQVKRVCSIDVYSDFSEPEAVDNDIRSQNELQQLLRLDITAIEKKSVHVEVRFMRDLLSFTNDEDAIILLDGWYLNIEKLLHVSVKTMVESGRLSEANQNDAINCMLTAETLPQFATVIVASSVSTDDESDAFAVVIGSLPTLDDPVVVFHRLKDPLNVGRHAELSRYVVLVFGPTIIKGTKTSLEVGRTFATVLMNDILRLQLDNCHTPSDIKSTLSSYASVDAKKIHSAPSLKVSEDSSLSFSKIPCGGLINDIKRRAPFYFSDFRDGIVGPPSTVSKMLSATMFLYFACLLPAIAFGALNHENTEGKMYIKKMIWAQGIGGTIFALFGGQPLIVLLTTAPLSLYIKVIYEISNSAEDEKFFFQFYGWVGLWNSFFLIIYSITDLSVIMKHSTRSIEETFAFFIAIAFTVDAGHQVHHVFVTYYSSSRDVALLFVILLLGTVFIGVQLYKFRYSPFLGNILRGVLSEYALPIAVLIMSFVGSYIFRAVKHDEVKESTFDTFTISDLGAVSFSWIFAAMGIAFPLSLLFFMDQNISSALVNTPNNRLKKGHAYHWDLFVVAIINAILSVLGLPWVHAALPHSPMHVRALADREQHVVNGVIIERVVHVRETRLSALFSQFLVGLSVLMVPEPLKYIPTAVLYGLFLYLAITSLDGSQLYERVLLLFTQQSRYPAHHYLRRVPQRVIHQFTGMQLVCVLILCIVSFVNIKYLNMCFPLVIALFMPLRKYASRFFDPVYLAAIEEAD